MFIYLEAGVEMIPAWRWGQLLLTISWIILANWQPLQYYINSYSTWEIPSRAGHFYLGASVVFFILIDVFPVIRNLDLMV